MARLLSATTDAAIVVASDGIEFVHEPGGAKTVGSLNQRKLLVASQMPIAVAVHGQNRLFVNGTHHTTQPTVLDLIEEELDTNPQEGTVIELASWLGDQLNERMLETFDQLEMANLTVCASGIILFGFGNQESKARVCELWWQPDVESFKIVNHRQNVKSPTVLHTGTGKTFAEAAIQQGYPVKKIANAKTEDKLQGYVRRFFRKTVQLQGQEESEFGGEYQDITVTKGGAVWTTRNSKTPELPMRTLT